MLSKLVPIMVLFSAGWALGEFYEEGILATDKNALISISSEPLMAPSRSQAFPRLSKNQESPQDTVEGLHSRANEPQEPSRESEERYVEAIRTWLDTLEPVQQEKARQIMREAHPGLQALRDAIRAKKSQLAAISFDRGMPPETLPRLGMELQKLRASLNRELEKVNEKLRYEAGIRMDTSNHDTFWLFPPESLKN
ncbi:MAG: periplasmic heavy metal sensor [Desulfovibrio sp.]|nr:periplasmic heavy metal sensor [Desulfovibrio sp.]